MTEVNDIFTKINLLRTNPNAFKANVTTVSKALKRIKKLKPAAELDEFVIELDSIKSIQALKLSKGLSKFCEDELDKIIKTKTKEVVKNNDYLKKYSAKFVKNTTKLFMAYDMGEIDFLVSRIIVSEYDVLKQNKKNILMADYNYIGIAIHEDSEGDKSTVIVLADHVEELEDDFDPSLYHELKLAFDAFDVNKTELLDAKDLKKAMRQLNFDQENPTLFEVIASFDNPDNHLGIDFKTFCLAFDKTLSDNKTKPGLQRLFNLFVDDVHSQVITEANIRKICTTLGISLKNREAQEIIENASLNGKEIPFEEFYTIMTSHVNN